MSSLNVNTSVLSSTSSVSTSTSVKQPINNAIIDSVYSVADDCIIISMNKGLNKSSGEEESKTLSSGSSLSNAKPTSEIVRSLSRTTLGPVSGDASPKEKLIPILLQHSSNSSSLLIERAVEKPSPTPVPAAEKSVPKQDLKALSGSVKTATTNLEAYIDGKGKFGLLKTELEEFCKKTNTELKAKVSELEMAKQAKLSESDQKLLSSSVTKILLTSNKIKQYLDQTTSYGVTQIIKDFKKEFNPLQDRIYALAK